MSGDCQLMTQARDPFVVASGWNRRAEVFGDICWEKILALFQTTSMKGRGCWRRG